MEEAEARQEEEYARRRYRDEQDAHAAESAQAKADYYEGAGE